MEIYIDKHQPSKGFILELVNATTNYKRFKKNKFAKMRNVLTPFKVAFFILLSAFLLSLLASIVLNDQETWIITIEIGACLAVLIIVWLGIKFIYKKAYKNFGGVTIDINEEGITHRQDGVQEIKIPWDNVYMVRIFKELTAIYPKNEGGIIVLLENKYTPELIRGLAEYNKNDLIVQ